MMIICQQQGRSGQYIDQLQFLATDGSSYGPYGNLSYLTFCYYDIMVFCLYGPYGNLTIVTFCLLGLVGFLL